MNATPARPIVSIIVAAFNAGAYIADTLRSLIAQTYRPIEVIVVDDGSTDDTREEVAAFSPDVTYIYQPNSGGCSQPRNTGLTWCRGDLVTVFDADDVMLPDKMCRQVAFLQAHPEAGSVLMDYRNFSTAGPAQQTHFATCPGLLRFLGGHSGSGEALIAPADAKRLLVAENFSIAGSPLFRRSALEAAGAYDPALKASEDFDVQYRVSSQHATGVIPEVGFLHRIHGSNMSGDTPRMLRCMIQSRRKLLRHEQDRDCGGLLASAVADLYLAKGYYYCGRDNLAATAATFASLRYRPWPVVPPARNLARILASPFRGRPAARP